MRVGGVVLAKIFECVGSLGERWWLLLKSLVWICPLYMFLVTHTIPAIGRTVYSSNTQSHREQLETLKRSLEQSLEKKRAQSSFKVNIGQEEGTSELLRVDTVLEFVNSSAKSARVKIDSFSSEPPAHSVGQKSQSPRYRLHVSGSFSALNKLTRELARTTNGLILSDLIITNPAWPEFSEVLKAQLILGT